MQFIVVTTLGVPYVCTVVFIYAVSFAKCHSTYTSCVIICLTQRKHFPLFTLGPPHSRLTGTV